jgi:hypothetical protein
MGQGLTLAMAPSEALSLAPSGRAGSELINDAAGSRGRV